MPDPSQARPDIPIFYSELMRAVENLGLEKASGTQWLGTLNNLRGVKKEEMRWVGLPEWLAGQHGPVTKGEVLDFLGAREVRVKEVVKGGESFAEIVEAVAFDQGFWARIDQEDDPDAGKWTVNFRDTPCGVFSTEQEAKEALIHEARDFLESDPGRRNEYKNMNTAFSAYQLPGGERYRELLLTLSMRGGEYASSHFDEKNVLVHVRFNERTDIDGKRLLFLEEIQSDWHQDGRRLGYREGKPKAATYQDYAAHQGIPAEEARHIEHRNDPSDPAWREMAQWMEEENREGIILWHAKVPNAPFKTSWPELALKRMLRWGAEHGFDRIGWTMGTQQAQRYRYEAGERMHRFYDKMLPAVANKYGKKWGVKAGQTSMDTGPLPYRLHYENGVWQAYEGDQSLGHPIGAREDADEFLHDLAREGLGGTVEVHSLDMTPAMRDSVMHGQPLFLAFGSVPPGKGEIVERQGAPMENQDRAGRNAQESLPAQAPREGHWLDKVRELIHQEPLDVNTLDGLATAAYEQHCKSNGFTLDDAQRREWIANAHFEAAHWIRYEEHLAEGPFATGEERRLDNEIEDRKGDGAWETAHRLSLELRILQAENAPEKWSAHIERCREDGFHELADSFQGEKDQLTPVWERAAKEAAAELRDFEALDALGFGIDAWRYQEKWGQSNQEGEKEPPKGAKEGPVTHEQSNRESQEAAKIREGMMARIADKVEKKMEELQSSPMAEWYGKIQDVVSAPLADIRRRVVEEGFYGKTVFDVMHDRQNQNTFWGPQQEKPLGQTPDRKPVEDQDAGKGPTAAEMANMDAYYGLKDQEQAAEKSEYDKEMTDIMKDFYGKDQGRDDEHQDMGHDRGMER